MSKLPTERFLSLYWIPSVGIGKPKQNVHVPLTDVLNYTLADGTPQASLVYLFAGTLTDDTKFSKPYINIKDDILSELVAQPGHSISNVKKLQNAGIKVVLSVLGSNNTGWSTIPSDKQADFAAWVQSDIIEKYSLDGIDIDDEGGPPQVPQQFVDTVAYLRNAIGNSLISKALWNDYTYFPLPVSSKAPLSGSYLSQLLDFGATMSYGVGYNEQIDLIAYYHNITNASGSNVGMAYDKLCVGVQAGPPESSWMTSIGETLQLAQWSVEPQSKTKSTPPIMGMMLFTFPQDIQQWDEYPQNQQKYMWPNPGDHRWQQAITLGMWDEFTVQSKLAWQDTGINIASGTTVTITYKSGAWTSNPNDSGGELFNAAGNPNYIATQPGYTLDGAAEGALIGRIGASGQPFLVGNGPTVTPANQSGNLELCINDDLNGLYGAGLTDNIGTVTVKIS